MASPKFIQQMRARGSDHPDDLLKKMADVECLRWLAANPSKPKMPALPKPPPYKTVHFTGFRAARKIELMHLAASKHWTVRATNSKTISHLCTGDEASDQKIADAQKWGAAVVTERDFLALLETGAPK